MTGRLALQKGRAPVLIGYARHSTDKQNLAAQADALIKLGVGKDPIYTAKGFTGRNRGRPGVGLMLDPSPSPVPSGEPAKAE